MNTPHLSQKPSEITEVYWVMATAPRAESGPNTGKWMLFVSFADLDESWALIAAETEAGRLGVAAKAATAKPNPNARRGGGKLICVYTRDYTDRDDVGRVLARLRELGFKSRLSYKTDEATLTGRYGSGVSSYVSPPGSLSFEDR